MITHLFFRKFVLLLLGHALADFALQNDTMAKMKNRHKVRLDPLMPGWGYWMMAHAMIHGLMVFIVLGSIPLTLAETVCHFAIDYLKCDRHIDTNEDQVLHAFCKVIWAATH